MDIGGEMGTRNFRFRSESLPLDATARQAAPGQFAALPDGTVHYELAGPSDAQCVVLVHGFSVPYYIWDPVFGPLVEAGFRVLRYDLYGRGYSDRPDTAYDQDLFDRQLWHLLPALGLEEPVDLVGLSMGGAIAVTFAHRHPDRVRKLVLMDPAGLPQKHPWVAKVVTAPILGEWVMDLLGDRFLVSGLRDDVHDPRNLPPDYMARYREQMQYVGFKRALLSTLRSGILTGAEEAYRGVGQQGHPVLCIWGLEDRTVPFALSQRVKELIPQAELRAIASAGHVPYHDQPQEVLAALVQFLSA